MFIMQHFGDEVLNNWSGLGRGGEPVCDISLVLLSPDDSGSFLSHRLFRGWNTAADLMLMIFTTISRTSSGVSGKGKGSFFFFYSCFSPQQRLLVFFFQFWPAWIVHVPEESVSRRHIFICTILKKWARKQPQRALMLTDRQFVWFLSHLQLCSLLLRNTKCRKQISPERIIPKGSIKFSLSLLITLTAVFQFYLVLFTLFTL